MSDPVVFRVYESMDKVLADVFRECCVEGGGFVLRGDYKGRVGVSRIRSCRASNRLGNVWCLEHGFDGGRSFDCISGSFRRFVRDFLKGEIQ